MRGHAKSSRTKRNCYSSGGRPLYIEGRHIVINNYTESGDVSLRGNDSQEVSGCPSLYRHNGEHDQGRFHRDTV